VQRLVGQGAPRAAAALGADHVVDGRRLTAARGGAERHDVVGLVDRIRIGAGGLGWVGWSDMARERLGRVVRLVVQRVGAVIGVRLRRGCAGTSMAGGARTPSR
jgi:hypothetical protein